MHCKILLLLLISSQFCFAQQKKLIIQGQVLIENGDFLPTANIVDINSKVGTVTNLNGVFNLTLPKQATSINISHIGYSTIIKKITTVDIDQIKNDTLFLSFNLKESTVDLTSVQINSSSIQLVYEEANVSILDYVFYKEDILLLLLDNKEYKLRLVDVNSITLFDLSIRNNPDNLFKDCHDKLHLQYNDRSYPIKFQNKEFYLENGHNRDEFDRIASPCITTIGNILFLLNYGRDNKVLYYSTLKKGTKQKQGFHLIANKSYLTSNQDYRMEEIIRHKRKVKGLHMMGDNDQDPQSLLRLIERNEQYLEKTLTKPDYHPLFKINNSVFIFNHLVDSVFIYDSLGTYQSKFSIDYHNHNDWAEEVIVESDGQNIYTKFKKGDYAYLKQIDPNNGNIISTIHIKKHTFPEKIKVKGGFVYYLFSNPYSTGALYKIYRQSLN